MSIDLSNVVPKHGSHDSREHGMCAMEAAAYLAGEPHSDRPVCVSPVIATLRWHWNDDLPDDETRTKLLLPLLPHVLNTKSTDEVELKRRRMALDWLARVNAPAWLELAGFTEHAQALRALAPIVDEASAIASLPATQVAHFRCAAALPDTMGTEEETTRVVAMRAATRATEEAATRAAETAADTGDTDAWVVSNAAWKAAIAAASGMPLVPTVVMLQASACDLALRMCAVS